MSDNWRYLTEGETLMVQTMFGDEIDYSQVKIYHEKWIALQPDDRAITPDGNVYFAPTDSRYADDFSTWSSELTTQENINRQALFIHEMTHIWQEDHFVSPAARLMNLNRMAA